jgi:hypothetical protein
MNYFDRTAGVAIYVLPNLHFAQSKSSTAIE